MERATDLKEVPFETVGFLNAIECMTQGVNEGVAPGMVAALWSAQNPSLYFSHAVGHRRLVPTPLKMLTDSIFDLASVSKIFATASLLARMVDRGWLSWNHSVQSILPGFRFSGIKIRHLLSHTAGYEAWRPFFLEIEKKMQSTGQALCRAPINDRQIEMRKLVLSVDPQFKPGENCTYSDISAFLLGFILEEVLNLPFHHAVQRHLWEPMGIQGAHFRLVTDFPDRLKDESIVATWDCPWRKSVLQGQVDDENCYAMGGYSGNAGAFGTARDLMQFARAWLGEFFSHDTRLASWTKVSKPAGCIRTLGWDTPSPDSTSSLGKCFSAQSVGHLGFTGTSFWIDPEAGIAVTLLTNRGHPLRENPLIRAFRPRFHEAIRQDFFLRFNR